ncbi:cytochrome P450 2 sub U member 1 [Bulinus truncatus]|nr:cytochrome P450 2 sub U member 1 [Bulinus truncatus]
MMIGPILSYNSASACLAVFVLILLLLMFVKRRPKNLPPSPGIALPFIGHVHLLKKNPRKQFKQWADRYGDVFALQMGPKTTVFINTFEAMKEAFVKKADYFSDRDQHFLAKHSPNFTKELSNKNGQPSDIRDLTKMSTSNVICSIIFGKRFEFDDPKFIKMMKLFNTLAKINLGVLALSFLPFLFYLPFDIFQGKKVLNIFAQIRSFTYEMVEEIKHRYDPDKVDNYILAYTDAMIKEQKSGEKSYLDDINLARNTDNLFLAGTDTTSSTILWCLLYALNNPDVQNKLFDEIVEHIGTDRLPNITDRPKMKYLTAFIMEVQRMASIAPLSLPHDCNAHTTVAGYTIPKGAVVLPNLDAVLRSKEVWGDPETFRPERFLDEQGNIVKREEFIPFSLGRRVCLGESLAMMELFLYVSTLFQKFEFFPPSPDQVPPLTKTFGTVAAPESFEIRCCERMN